MKGRTSKLIRFPQGMKERLEAHANRLGVDLNPLIILMLREKLNELDTERRAYEELEKKAKEEENN